jgi:hypothetical protein
MYGERRDASDGDMASWLERVGARLRELEAENAQLKQQLDDLRRGLGIAVMIEGRLVPLAALAPNEQPQHPRPAAGSQPRPAAPVPPSLLPHTGQVPVPTVTPRAQPAPAPARHSFGPLASTPDELPAVRGLLPASRQPEREWLGSGDAWPESSAPGSSVPLRRRRPARTLGHAVSPARPAATSDPLWRESPPSHDQRSPFADSFIL